MRHLCERGVREKATYYYPDRRRRDRSVDTGRRHSPTLRTRKAFCLVFSSKNWRNSIEEGKWPVGNRERGGREKGRIYQRIHLSGFCGQGGRKGKQRIYTLAQRRPPCLICPAAITTIPRSGAVAVKKSKKKRKECRH